MIHKISGPEGDSTARLTSITIINILQVDIHAAVPTDARQIVAVLICCGWKRAHTQNDNRDDAPPAQSVMG
ncbi:hypothetical protein SVAN01_03295 [Stagonosporopsis vannaccii]|nr:hypothetical protein SVAN01_03295 [Stagonosporopsis vannaccii]